VPPQRFPLEIDRRTLVPLVKDSTLAHFAPRDFGTAVKGKEANAKCHRNAFPLKLIAAH
jgi:hypothetical protein